jgi:hypothetical protein
VAARNYLLVYHARGGDGADHLRDLGNDPDFRERPYSWGICRPDVRRNRRPGDQLFFVATLGTSVEVENRYWLAGFLEVSDIADQFEAARRLPGRENVILDLLHGAGDQRHDVRSYIEAHADRLQWPDRDKMLAAIRGGSFDAREVTAEHEGDLFIHSWWDSHEDWRSRAAQPYVIGSPASLDLLPGIPYARVSAAIPSLPPPEALRTKVGFMYWHIKRPLSIDEASGLRQLVASTGTPRPA